VTRGNSDVVDRFGGRAIDALGYRRGIESLRYKSRTRVPKGYAAHLAHLLDEAPVPMVVMAVEEAAAKEGVAPKAVWRNVAKLARSLAVHRQGLRA